MRLNLTVLMVAQGERGLRRAVLPALPIAAPHAPGAQDENALELASPAARGTGCDAGGPGRRR